MEYKTTMDLFNDAMSGKWKTLIVWVLNSGPKRTNELQKTIPGISQRVLINAGPTIFTNSSTIYVPSNIEHLVNNDINS